MLSRNQNTSKKKKKQSKIKNTALRTLIRSRTRCSTTIEKIILCIMNVSAYFVLVGWYRNARPGRYQCLILNTVPWEERKIRRVKKIVFYDTSFKFDRNFLNNGNEEGCEGMYSFKHLVFGFAKHITVSLFAAILLFTRSNTLHYRHSNIFGRHFGPYP